MVITENELLVRPPPPLAPPAFTPFEVVHAHDCTFYTKLEMKTEITWSLD